MKAINKYRKAKEYRSIAELSSILFDKLYDNLNTLIFKAAFYKIGENVHISRRSRISFAKKISIGNNVVIGEHAWLSGYSQKEHPSIIIGDNTIIAPFAMIDARGGCIKIGRDCSVNPFCTLYGAGGLEIGDSVRIATKSTIIPANHGFNRTDIPIFRQALTKNRIRIEDDVWIGANVTILEGVTIHKGSVIGAGAVVTKDIPEYSIAVGVPCKVIKKRN
jgi:acetyltransferase-like isoleucine patch superfamily enzyme